MDSRESGGTDDQIIRSSSGAGGSSSDRALELFLQGNSDRMNISAGHDGHADGVHGSSQRRSKHHIRFPFPQQDYRLYRSHGRDTSPRCRLSRICDADGGSASHSHGRSSDSAGSSTTGCSGSSSSSSSHVGKSKDLACISSAAERLDRIRDAARWTWSGYK